MNKNISSIYQKIDISNASGPSTINNKDLANE
jgi:hypothetical protein